MSDGTSNSDNIVKEDEIESESDKIVVSDREQIDMIDESDE